MTKVEQIQAEIEALSQEDFVRLREMRNSSISAMQAGYLESFCIISNWVALCVSVRHETETK